MERSWLKRDDFGVKKGPKDVPKGAQMKKATKAKCKTCIKAKKTRELKERCGATPMCIGNVYFGHNSLVWWLIRANQIRILGFLGVLDALVQSIFPKKMPLFYYVNRFLTQVFI